MRSVVGGMAALLRVLAGVAVAVVGAANGAAAQDTTDGAVAPEAAERRVPPPPETIDLQRIFVDTFVSDVQVDDTMTVVVMDVSPRSPCPSNVYVFSRDEPKWLYQTGRLLVALREPARVRISFSCVDGSQILNAVQFLDPPRVLSRATPRSDQAVGNTTGGIERDGSPFPLPGEVVREERPPIPPQRTRQIPIR